MYTYGKILMILMNMYQLTGGEGGAGIRTTRNQYYSGNPGADGSLRATGGGGSGASNASDEHPVCYSGSGSRGTSYSGGSGGGGADRKLL